MNNSKREKIFKGNGVSTGIALGQALKLDSHNRVIVKVRLENDQLVEEEVRRFRSAIEAAKSQLEALRGRLEEKAGPELGFILDVHLLILEDKGLQAEIVGNIRKYRANAEWAVRRATDRVMRAYETLEDEYFRDRRGDIESAMDRIILNLSGGRAIAWESLPENLIIVSHDFSPSALAVMDIQKVCGLALEHGGRTSHSAIIARGLHLPAVMGIPSFMPYVFSGDQLLLDGEEGLLVVHPSLERIDQFRKRVEELKVRTRAVIPVSSASVLTRDDVAISLRANTEFAHEAEIARANGAQGIGLFRSEFLFFSHPQGRPGMEEQLKIYSGLAEIMAPHPVAIRTLDMGSDKFLAGSDLLLTPNPSMGLRGIRSSLLAVEGFSTQIEAIVRASSAGAIEMVLPMVTTVEEIWAAKAILQQVYDRVGSATGRVPAPLSLGAMIEVPAAVLSLESLAREVDFLCIGTNDLIQYLLAVDRGNPQVARLFQPLNPSVLKCLVQIAEVGAAMNKAVRICGEISSNPFYAILLIGMGYRQLSMNPLAIPGVRRIIQEISLAGAQVIARQIAGFATAHEAAEYLIEALTAQVTMDLAPFVKEIAAPVERGS